MLRITTYLLEEAYRLSQKSNVERAKFGCFISSGKNILVKSHNVSFYGLKDKWTIHAEELAILRGNRLRVFNRYDDLMLYVFRFNNDGDRMISYPCKKCLNLINNFSIKGVVYFDRNGEVKEL